MYQSFIELIHIGLYGFSMALNIDCLHILGTISLLTNIFTQWILIGA